MHLGEVDGERVTRAPLDLLLSTNNLFSSNHQRLHGF